MGPKATPKRDLAGHKQQMSSRRGPKGPTAHPNNQKGTRETPKRTQNDTKRHPENTQSCFSCAALCSYSC